MVLSIFSGGGATKTKLLDTIPRVGKTMYCDWSFFLDNVDRIVVRSLAMFTVFLLDPFLDIDACGNWGHANTLTSGLRSAHLRTLFRHFTKTEGGLLLFLSLPTQPSSAQNFNKAILVGSTTCSCGDYSKASTTLDHVSGTNRQRLLGTHSLKFARGLCGLVGGGSGPKTATASARVLLN